MEENELSFVGVEEGKMIYKKDIKSFKDLIVWQRGMELVKAIYIATREMPEDERFGLTSQIRRAAVSVPCNIAEGWGRDTTGNYIQHLRIANGSLCEVDTQVLLIEMLEFLEKSKLDKSKNLVEETGRMLRSLISVLEKQKKN